MSSLMKKTTVTALDVISKVSFDKDSIKTYKQAFPQLSKDEENEKLIYGKSGNPLQIQVADIEKAIQALILEGNDESEVRKVAEAAIEQFIPEVDEFYHNDVAFLRHMNMAMVLNKPLLVYGHYGTGKTTKIEQFCAGTKRPYMRVQHTISMEESHVLGQMSIVIDPETKQSITEFKPGPLALAMRYGLLYLADEYDFALPSVTSVYQPILEGKSLIIKEAPEDSGWRYVKPHKNFRFVATGNTNGQGDDTGLYTGTQRMNAANYSRFAMAIRAEYMDTTKEAAILISQAGLTTSDGRTNSAVASAFTRFAKELREEFDKNTSITVTISPRELIHAALIGKMLGGTSLGDAEWMTGLELAYLNRLSNSDKVVIEELAQRHLGGKVKTRGA